MKRLLSALALALSSVAQAGDRLPVAQVRFSPSSDRVLALTVGAHDGSGLGGASLSVLETVSGTVLYRRTALAPTPAAARAKVLSTTPTPARLSGFGLTPGVVSLPRFVRSYASDLPDYVEAVLAGQTQTTAVPLWTVPVPVKLSVFARPAGCPAQRLNGYTAAGFRLQVRGQWVHADLPGGDDHPCAVGYTLDRVDVRGNRALLTVRAYSIGFEGPNAEPIYVAARLK